MFTDFEYAGKRLSDFGWITCHIDNRPGVSELDIGCDITFNTVKNNHSSIHYATSTSYDNVCTSQPFKIMKNPCGKNQEDLYAIRDEIRVLTTWLNRHDYRKFKPLYDSDEWADIHYYGSFNVKEKTIGDKIIGLVLTFTGNAPYGFGEHIFNEIDMDNNEVTASGQVIHETDCAAVPPINIKLFGKGKQRRYEGNQLADLPNVEEVIINGVVWSCKDGVVTAKGTSTNISNTSGRISCQLPILAGTYCVSGSGSNANVYVLVKLSDGSEKYYHEKSFTLDGTEAEVRFYLSVQQSGLSVNETLYPMLNYGSIPLPFEPYVGGEQSPNMKYPQKVECLGESGGIENKILTGNVYNPSFRRSYDGLFNANNCTVTEEKGLFTIVATGTDITLWDICYGEYSSYNSHLNGQLMKVCDAIDTIGICLSNYEFNKNYINFYDNNMQSLGSVTIMSNKGTVSVLDGAKYFTLRFGKGDAVVGKTYETTVMVNYGEPMDYEPYTEQPFTALTPNGLIGLPVTDYGNYIDLNGQHYMANIKDYERGKNIQNVYSFRMSADLTWAYAKTSTNKNHNFQIRLNANGFPKGWAWVDTQSSVYLQATKFTHFRFIDVGFDTANFRSAKAYVHDDELTISFTEDSEINSLETWKQFLTDNEVYVYYVLKDPIITDLTQEELAEYNALVMNYPNTTIVNDAGAYMEVTYLQDYDNEIVICGDGDEYTTLYPNISITCKRDGDLKIKNTLTGEIFEVLNCSKDETIYVNGEHKYIDSDNKNHKETTLFNDFNYNYLDINITNEDFNENIYETSIPCKIVIDYSPIRKVGV